MSGASASSGGWKTLDSDDEDDEDAAQHANGHAHGGKAERPGENEHVTVTPPGSVVAPLAKRACTDAPSPPLASGHAGDGDAGASGAPGRPSSAHALLHEQASGAHEPLEEHVPQALCDMHAAQAEPEPKPESHPESVHDEAPRRSGESARRSLDDDELEMPGSFHGSRRRHSQSHHVPYPHFDGTLAALLRKMHMR